MPARLHEFSIVTIAPEDGPPDLVDQLGDDVLLGANGPRHCLAEISVVTIAPEACRHLEFITYSTGDIYLLPTRITDLTTYLHWTFRHLWAHLWDNDNDPSLSR